MSGDLLETTRQMSVFAGALWEPDDLVEVRCLRVLPDQPKATREFWFKAADLPSQAEMLTSRRPFQSLRSFGTHIGQALRPNQ